MFVTTKNTFANSEYIVKNMRGSGFFVLFVEANGHEQLVKREQCNDPPTCPARCGPIYDEVCCLYILYCAATFAECPLCPFESRREKLMEIPLNKLCDGTMCHNGCCGNSEGWTCAERPADCNNS